MTAPAGGTRRYRKSPVLRNLLLLTGFACVTLSVGWSAYWYIAQRMAMQEFRAQIDREAQQGRIWSCDALGSGGYPLSVAIDCLGPRLQTKDSLHSISVAARRAQVRANLYTPTLVEIQLDGPARIQTDADRVSLDWSSMRIDARGLPQRLDRLSMVGRALTATAQSTATVEALQFHLKRTAPSPMSPYALTIGLAGLNSPDLARIAGPGGPALLTVLGSVTQLDAARAGPVRERVDSWRVAGGRLSISALNLSRDDLQIEGEGVVGLDRQRRPEGKLAVKLRNAGPALLTILEDAGLLQRNTIAGRLAAMALGRPGDVRFDVAAETGTLSVGPLRGMIPLPPLY